MNEAFRGSNNLYIFAELGDLCEHPDDSMGMCTLFKDCPSVVARYAQDKSPETIEYIRSISCPISSLVGGRRSVCCADLYDTCLDPFSNNGLCVPLDKCQAVKDKLKPPISRESARFLRKSQCNFKDNMPWVCCSPTFKSGGRVGSEEVISEPESSTAARTTTSTTAASTTRSTTRKTTTTVATESPVESVTQSALEIKIQQKIKKKLIYNAPNCGQHSSDKITNGEVTMLDEFPWLALIGYSKRIYSKKNLTVFRSSITFFQLTTVLDGTAVEVSSTRGMCLQVGLRR